MTKAKRKSIGRPSKYRQEYDEQLIAHMRSGLSFESFAGVIKVNQDTLHEWVKVHASFSEAKKIAWTENLLFWERMGLTGMAGKIRGFNATIWIFNMKNRFKWHDNFKPQEDPKAKNQETLDHALKLLDHLRDSRDS